MEWLTRGNKLPRIPEIKPHAEFDRGLIMSFGTFFRFYYHNLLPNANDSSLGIIGGTQAFLTLSLSFIMGRLLDAQLHKWIVGVGGCLTFLGVLCLSFSIHGGLDGKGDYGVIYFTQGIVMGTGMACFFMHSSQLAVQVSMNSRHEN